MPHLRPNRLIIALVSLAMVASSCAGDGDGSATGGVQVVATTSVVGDIVGNVLGDLGDVEVLIPTGVDPHTFQPSSRQASAMVGSDLVVAVGLGLEEGLSDVLEAAADDGARILYLGPLLEPSQIGDGGPFDPHVWMDPLRAGRAAVLIADELNIIEPNRGWASRAGTYVAEMDEVNRRIADLIDTVPPERRRMITNHDSFGYFAERFGLEVVGTVIQGGSPAASPSASELAALVEIIDDLDIRAILAETTEPLELAEAIASEASHRMQVVEVYSGSLGASGSGAETLAGMLLVNADRIVAALTS